MTTLLPNPRLLKIPDEVKCQNIAKKIISENFLCANCGNKAYYFKNDKKVFECSACGRRYSLKYHSIMYKSKLPISYWIYALDNIYHEDMPEKQLAELINHTRLATVYDFVSKIKTKLLHSRATLDEGYEKFLMYVYMRDPSYERTEDGLIELYTSWLLGYQP